MIFSEELVPIAGGPVQDLQVPGHDLATLGGSKCLGSLQDFGFAGCSRRLSPLFCLHHTSHLQIVGKTVILL